MKKRHLQAIYRIADKIFEKAIEEKSTSKILRSKKLLVEIFRLRYNGSESENSVACATGVNRAGLNRLIKRGRNKNNRKMASGIFSDFWDRCFAKPKEIINEQLIERAIDPSTPSKEKIEIQKHLYPEYRYDPTGKINHGNQTLQITNNYYSPEVLKAVQLIVDLPKEKRQLAFEQLDEIILNPEVVKMEPEDANA